MVRKLNALGYPISFERVQTLAGDGAIGRPHVAQALIEARLVQNKGEAFERLIGRNGPAYVMTGATPPADVASAARVKALIASLRLQPGVELPAGPLLLVDVRYRSGWTMTVAAALLREAGATAMLPLVLHQLP